jgi:hypothetical protein
MKARDIKTEPKALIEAALRAVESDMDRVLVGDETGKAILRHALRGVADVLPRVGKLSDAIGELADTYGFRVTDAPGTVTVGATESRARDEWHRSERPGPRLVLDTTTPGRPSPIGSAEHWRQKLEARERYFAEEEEKNTRLHGMLADVCDVLFESDDRASTKGYDGVVERAKALVKERNAALLKDANPTVMWLLSRMEQQGVDMQGMLNEYEVYHDELVRLDATLIQSGCSSWTESSNRPVHREGFAKQVVDEARDVISAMERIATILDPMMEYPDTDALMAIRREVEGAGFVISEGIEEAEEKPKASEFGEFTNPPVPTPLKQAVFCPFCSDPIWADNPVTVGPAGPDDMLKAGETVHTACFERRMAIQGRT